MNKEEIQEIENTLKLTKPYNELGSYNYFNCESIEKLLNQYQKLENNRNELKEYLKKQTIDLEIKKEDMSADHYIDRKLFLKEVLNKMQELEGKSE